MVHRRRPKAATLASTRKLGVVRGGLWRVAKIVFIDAFELIHAECGYTDTGIDHQARDFVAID